jgi:hypothetical protein
MKPSSLDGSRTEDRGWEIKSASAPQSNLDKCESQPSLRDSSGDAASTIQFSSVRLFLKSDPV